MSAHVPAIEASPRFRLAAVTNSDPAAAKAAALKFGIPQVFQRPEGLLASPDVDLVVVAVRVPRHFELVRAAIQAGKSIYCEWPLANGLEEALELERLASKHGTYLAVGLQSRGSPEMTYVRELLSQGYIGEVLSISLLGTGIIGGATIPESFSYTLDPQNGAGMLNVAFAHGLDSVCYVLASRMRDVSATLQIRQPRVKVLESGGFIEKHTPDDVAINGRMQSGVVVSAHYRGGQSRVSNFRLEIYGSGGELVITSSMGYPGVGDTQVQGGLDEGGAWGALPVPSPKTDGLGKDMARNVTAIYSRIADDLERGTHTAPGLADAVALHRLIQAIQDAASSGRRQDW